MKSVAKRVLRRDLLVIDLVPSRLLELPVVSMEDCKHLLTYHKVVVMFGESNQNQHTLLRIAYPKKLMWVTVAPIR